MRTHISPTLRLVRVLGAVAACSLWTSSAAASSTGVYLDTIPNGNLNSCLNCHTDLVGPTLNSFGDSVFASMDYVTADAGGMPVWSELCGGDSDGDGQTNGQELGDPCCTWQEGQSAPRTTDISNPGDSTSLSGAPDQPSCGSESDDGGGCAMVGGAAGLSGAAVALFMLAVSRPLRRRGRR